MLRTNAKSQAVTLALLCFVAAVGYGAEPTTMATLRWSGDGEFMSWRWEKLDEPFEDGDWGVYEVRLTTAPTTYVPPNEPVKPPTPQNETGQGFVIIIK